MQPIKELRDRMIKDLCKIYPEKESYNQVIWLFRSIAGIDKTDFSIHPGIIVEADKEALLLSKFDELLMQKPVQYVTGTAYFYDIELEVNRSVLIPRPETEELVKWVLIDNKDISGLRVLDIGTGSGNIILALGRFLKNPDLTAIDISGGALEMASKNAGRMGIKVQFINKDIFTESDWNYPWKFDLIISNPPYVRELEKTGMHSNVLDYEPHLALFVPDNDPLRYYRAIARFSSLNLKQDGKLYVEINENLGAETLNLLKKSGFSNLVLNQDFSGKDRMIRAGF